MSRVKRDRTGTPTERALVRMLMENTGQHFMDSGGAYGRAWQRNQATGMWHTKDWLATPEVWAGGGYNATVDEVTGVETSDDVWPVLSLFHYLRQRLVFDSQLTAWLIREGNRTDDYWLESMVKFAADRDEGDRDSYWSLGGDYTYNHETLLSQDFQYERFTYRDEPCIAIQVHGGADARGGFTTPKVFQVTTDEAYSLFDWDKWSFGHEQIVTDVQEPLPGLPSLPVPEQHRWESQGSRDWVDYDGTYVSLADYAGHGHLGDDGKSLVWEKTGEVTWAPRCPIDGALCEVWAPHAW